MKRAYTFTLDGQLAAFGDGYPAVVFSPREAESVRRFARREYGVKLARKSISTEGSVADALRAVSGWDGVDQCLVPGWPVEGATLVMRELPMHLYALADLEKRSS